MNYKDIVPDGTQFCFDKEHEQGVIDLAKLADDGDMQQVSGIWWKVLNACAGSDDYKSKGFNSEVEMIEARNKLLEIFDKLVANIRGDFCEVSRGVEQLRWVMDARKATQLST